MYRATYYVTVLVEVPVAGNNYPEAYVSAQRKTVTDLVKIKGGEFIDGQIQLSGITDSSVNGEM